MACSYTRCSILFPCINASGLPGNLLEAYLAGIIPITDIKKFKNKITKKLIANFTVVLVMLKRVCFIGFGILLSLKGFSQGKTCVQLLHQMNDSIKKIKTLKMHIYAIERIDKTYLSANSEIKLNSSPRKLYFINPKKKLEILHLPAKNEKAIVKPHVFPYVTMHLDPNGNMMRKNQHYTLNELGFDFISKSIAFTINKDKEGTKHFKYHGLVKKNGVSCYFMEYDNAHYEYVDYKVGKRETVTSLSYKLGVNDYLVRYKNDLINEFGFLKEGKIIKVPTLYCKKAVIYLSESTLLPISLSLYDDIGLFENYEFSNIQINPSINEIEFTTKFHEYKF
jgi:hypothetical protein